MPFKLKADTLEWAPTQACHAYFDHVGDDQIAARWSIKHADDLHIYWDLLKSWQDQEAASLEQTRYPGLPVVDRQSPGDLMEPNRSFLNPPTGYPSDDVDLPDAALEELGHQWSTAEQA